MITPRTRPTWLAFVAFALTLSLFIARAPVTTAQESLIPEGAPVGIHSGTCEDFLTEPAADGGEIEETTSDDVWDEDQLQAGMLVDESAGISGVDMNGDQSLQPSEVVLLNLQTAPVGKAQVDFDTEIDATEPMVVVVHASSEAYDTILNCGSLDSGRTLESGVLTMLQPQGDSQLFGYAVLDADGTTLTTYLFQPNLEAAESATPVATNGQGPEGYPVEVHQGTCQDWTMEPTYDIGNMQKTNVAAEGEQDAGDTSGEVPAEAESLGDVYKIDEDTDFNANQLFDDEHSYVITVHESADNYENLVACGQMLQVMDGDEVLVILQPVGDSGQTGFVRLGQDSSGAKGFLWNCQPLQPTTTEATPTPMPTLEPTPSPTAAPTEPATPEPSPTATLEPTPTEEATAVIVETTVATETEVVPAPTATAQAEEESEG